MSEPSRLQASRMSACSHVGTPFVAAGRERQDERQRREQRHLCQARSPGGCLEAGSRCCPLARRLFYMWQHTGVLLTFILKRHAEAAGTEEQHTTQTLSHLVASASMLTSACPSLLCSDTPKQIKNKVNKHAFSGGGATAEEQREKGEAGRQGGRSKKLNNNRLGRCPSQVDRPHGACLAFHHPTSAHRFFPHRHSLTSCMLLAPSQAPTWRWTCPGSGSTSSWRTTPSWSR